MSETIMTIAGIACMVAVVLVFVYRASPGLSDAMSAWAKRQQDLTVNRLAEEYVKGFHDGAERGQQKREGTK